MARIQLRRTLTNIAPALLSQGEPSVELGGTTRMWVGDGGANRLLLSSNPADNPLATNGYLRLTGGTVTGDTTFSAGNVTVGAAARATETRIAINAAGTQNRMIEMLTNGARRWIMYTGGGEPGVPAGNAGSDFSFDRYLDSGARVVVWGANRNTGLVTFASGVALTGAFDLTLARAPSLANHAVTKAYVDGLIPSGGPFLPLAGGAVAAAGSTVTGIATFTGNSTAIAISGAAGTWRTLQFYTGTSSRWTMQVSTAAETGGNVGSDFQINRFLDNGTPASASAPFIINRASGLTTLNFGLSFGGQTTASGNINDFGRHILLHTAGYGISVTGGTLNVVTGGNMNLAIGAAVIATITGTGLTMQSTRGIALPNNADVLLGRNPTNTMHAIPLGYADGRYQTPAQADARYVQIGGSTMTGQLLTIPPTLGTHAANKNYVDTLVASMRLFVGTWQVAANIPPLPGIGPPREGAGDYYIAVTAAPAHDPERPPAGIPGLPTTLDIHNGDVVIWNDLLSRYELVAGSPLTKSMADTFYVQKTGDTMSGGLSFGAATAAGNAITSRHVTLHTAGYGLGITTNRMNIVAPSGASAIFVNNAADAVTIGPNSVTTIGAPGQNRLTITPGGAVANNIALAATGPGGVTLTAPFVVNPAVAGGIEIGNNVRALESALYLNASAAQNRIIRFRTAGADRWIIYANGDPEVGDTGSNFNISRYTGAGRTSVIDIARATGLITLTGMLLLAGAPTLANHAVTKAYADGLVANPVGAGTWGKLSTGAWQRTVAVSGDAMTGGLTFGGAAQATTADLSRHIQLHTSGYGLSITANRLNVVTGNTIALAAGNTDLMTITAAGANFAGAVTAAGVLRTNSYLGVASNITTSPGQGAYVMWNRTTPGSGNGNTLLLNQRGLGSGGFSFSEIETNGTLTERVGINGAGHATFYGDLFVGAATAPQRELHIVGPAGAEHNLSFRIGNAGAAGLRWRVHTSPDAETGSDAGTNFYITPFSDAGGYKSIRSLTISRATGLATVSGDPTAPLGIATRQFVLANAGMSQAAADARYLQQVAADARYVNLAGDTMTGTLSVNTGRVRSVGNSDPAFAIWHTGQNQGVGMLMGAGHALHLTSLDVNGNWYAGATRATFDAAGNFFAIGNVNGIHVSAAGNVSATNYVFAPSIMAFTNGPWNGSVLGIGASLNDYWQMTVDTAATLYIRPIGGGTAQPGATLTYGGLLRLNSWIDADAVRSRTGLFEIAPNYYLQRAGSDGAWRFVEGGTINMTVAADGNVTARSGLYANWIQSYGGMYAAGQIQAGNFLTGSSMVAHGGGYFASDNQHAAFVAGNGWRYFQFYSGVGFWWDGYTITLQQEPGVGWPHTQFPQNGDLVLYSYWAKKDGGGPWIDRSDARIKNIEGDYTRGLDAVLRLQPKLFTFKGNDGRRRAAKCSADTRGSGSSPQAFIGLIAQDCEDIMPEMVFRTTGEIDGKKVDDMRVLDAGPLTFAMVNAIRELTARLEALEARIH